MASASIHVAASALSAAKRAFYRLFRQLSHRLSQRLQSEASAVAPAGSRQSHCPSDAEVPQSSVPVAVLAPAAAD